MSEAIQDARRWLAAYDSQPDGKTGMPAEGARHVRALLVEMALMGRRPAEAGYDWLMTNVDAQISQAIEAGNEHRHHEEDIHLRVAAIRSNQAVAAAMRHMSVIDTTAVETEWDTATAKEADAFQSVAMAVLGVSPGDLRTTEDYPDATAQAIIERCDHNGMADSEIICAALTEVGPWDEIDGDGDDTSIIVEHITHLGKLASSAKCKHGPALVDGIIEEMSPATDGDGIRLVIRGVVWGQAEIVDTISVTIHETPRGT